MNHKTPKSFKELLLESPMKMPGDAPFETLDYNSKSENGIKEEFDFLGEFQKIQIFKHKKLNWVIAGKFYTDENTSKKMFGIVAELSYTPQTFRSTSNKILLSRPVIGIDTVQVKEADRRSKIASAMYKTLLMKYNIMSDKLQYEKAALMWKNFATETDNTIYIYDAYLDKIISKMSSKTPDEHIWSDGSVGDTSKMKIRMVMVSNE